VGLDFAFGDVVFVGMEDRIGEYAVCGVRV